MTLIKPVNISEVVRILKQEFDRYPSVPVVDLIQVQTKDPFKVLIATILSARTSDRTTVNACKKLFSVVSKADDFENLTIKEVEKLIYPVGFYHNKAIYLKQLPKALNEKFGGRIPDTVEELLLLPGVGRKTANLVVAIGFDKPAIAIDVHVHRISNRLGYVKTKTPFETEMALRKKLPVKYWTVYNSILVAHGQHICRPITPLCSKCKIRTYCDRVGVKQSR